MKVKCKIVNSNVLSKGMKLTIHLDDKAADQFLPHLGNFRNKPLIADFNIDADKVKQNMSMINPDMRAKIYAIFNDISKWSGQSPDSVKENMKHIFLSNDHYHYEDFSLSDCSKELAIDFISFIIGWCFMNGIPLKDNPKDAMAENLEAYFFLCIKYKVCAICGKPAEIHHWNAIGMGRDRRKYDDSDHRKIALDRIHHTEVETIGRDTFAEKYHVIGILFND